MAVGVHKTVTDTHTYIHTNIHTYIQCIHTYIRKHILYSGKLLGEKTRKLATNTWQIWFLWRKRSHIAFAAPKDAIPPNFTDKYYANKQAQNCESHASFLPWKFFTMWYNIQAQPQTKAPPAPTMSMKLCASCYTLWHYSIRSYVHIEPDQTWLNMTN